MIDMVRLWVCAADEICSPEPNGAPVGKMADVNVRKLYTGVIPVKSILRRLSSGGSYSLSHQ